MKTWEIRDLDGELLHRGLGKTRKQFVETMVGQGRSFDAADLSDFDLNGCNLTGMRARGARFDGADLRGAHLAGADLTGSSLVISIRPRGDGEDDARRPTRLDGCRADRAVFDRCDLSDACFGGARVTYARFRGCLMDRTDFSGVSGSSSSFSHAHGEETNFSDAKLVNSDFIYADLVGPNFRGTNLDHRAFTGSSPEERERLSRHLPNRTHGARVVMGEYDAATRAGPTVPGIRADLRVSRFTRLAIAAGTMLGVVAGLNMADPGFEWISHALGGHGFKPSSVIMVVGATQFLGHAGFDIVKERLSDVLSDLASKVRGVMKEIDGNGSRRIHLVCAMLRGRSATPLRMALATRARDAERKGFLGTFRSFVGDLGEVVVCDRRHLALALETLSTHARSSFQLREEISVVRCDEPHCHGDSPFPCALRFMVDGRAAAVWPSGGDRHVTVLYGRDGLAESTTWSDGSPADPVEAGLPPEAAERLSTVMRMEAALLDDHGLGGFRYDRKDSELRAGRDGSILVQHRVERTMSNVLPGQPAIIRPDGSIVRIVGGRVVLDDVPRTAGDPEAEVEDASSVLAVGP